MQNFRLREQPKKSKMKVSREAVARAMLVPPSSNISINPFAATKPPPGVTGGRELALDEGFSATSDWASRDDRFLEGLSFMGYPYLAELSQRPEYRRMSEIVAKEMTRKWIKLQSKGDSDNTDKLAKIEAEMARLKVQSVFREALELDGFFGRAHIYLDTGDSSDDDELKLSIGPGAGKITEAKVNVLRPLKRLAVIEPVWTYPNAYNASNPLAEDYFQPTTWFVQGRVVHASRLITLVSRQVPDLLKPAYSFGGLSLSQMAKPYVDNWLRTRQSVSDLIHTFSVSILSTDLSSTLEGGSGEDLYTRAQLFTQYRDNQGLMLTDLNTEKYENVSVPLGGLDALQAQSQEHMAAVCGIPLVKLLGITPSGLNASSDGEMRCFYDWIEAQQAATCTEALCLIINLIQLSLFNEIDTNVGFKWQPLWTLDELGQATVRKMDADTSVVLIDSGQILPQEGRDVLAAQEDSPYAGIDVDLEIPAPGGEVPPGGSDDEVVSGSDPETVVALDAFVEADHPRGSPENAGEFSSAGGNKKQSTPANKHVSLADIASEIEKSGQPVYVRWSRGPAFDMSEGAASRDYLNGGEHSGLSAVPLTTASVADIAKFSFEYEFLRLKDPKLKPHFYIGKKVGEDSDGYASITPVKYLGTLNPEQSKKLEKGGDKRLSLQENIKSAEKRLSGMSDPFGIEITKKSISKNKAELDSLGGPLDI